MSAVEFKLLSSVRLDFPEEGEEGNTISFPQEGRFYFAQGGEKVPGGESHIITMFGISRVRSFQRAQCKENRSHRFKMGAGGQQGSAEA